MAKRKDIIKSSVTLDITRKIVTVKFTASSRKNAIKIYDVWTKQRHKGRAA